MSRAGACSARLAALLSLGVAACGGAAPISARDAADANDTGSTLAPSGESERALLRELASLPSGSERRFANTTVVADAPYTAASGHTCRALRIHSERSKVRGRLACSDGKTWFFVPDVFGADAEHAGN